MTYRIIIEPTAEREIRPAVRWKTEHASPAVAARWYNGLLKRIGTLHHHPYRCPLTGENDRFPEEIRELLYGRHKQHKHRIYSPSAMKPCMSSMCVTVPVTSWKPDDISPPRSGHVYEAPARLRATSGANHKEGGGTPAVVS